MLYMFILNMYFIFHLEQLRIVPILNGKCVLYSFESPPEVRIGVMFGVTEIPGIAPLLVCLYFYSNMFESKGIAVAQWL